MAKKAEFVFVGDADSVIRAATKAKAATNSLAGATDKDAKRMGSSYAAMGNAAKLAGVAIVGGLVVGVKKSVDAFQESEKSHARMTAQLKASGVSYRAHGKEIDAVIQKTSRLAALDDEDLQDAFTNIVRSTGSVSKSLKLTGLAADLARAKHLGVAKAGELVAKVAGGNVGALKRLGIAFNPVTRAQDALAKSHAKATVEQKRAAKESDKQATSLVALASLQSRVAGQAEAYGKTSAGAQDRFRVAVQNLEERVGSGLRPAITTVANAAATFITQLQDGTGAGGRFLGVVRGLVKPIQDVVKGFKDGKTWAVALVAGLAGLGTGIVVIRTIMAATKAWAAAQVLLNVALTANPIGVVIVGVAALAAGLVVAYKKSATFRNVVNGAFNAVRKAAEVVFPLIGKLARNGLLGPIPLIIARWGTIKKLPGQIVGFFKDLPGDMLKVGKSIIGGVASGIAAGAGALIKSLKEHITDAVPGFVKKALSIFSPSRVMHALGLNIGQGLADGIKASAGTITRSVQAGLLFPLDDAITKLTAKKDALQGSFDTADRTRERAGLVAAIGTARSDASSSAVDSGLGWARSMVGHFKESTGSNTGPELDRLQKDFGTHAAAWCAEFATTALIKAGAPKQIKSASVAQLQAWAAAGTHGLSKASSGRAGDLMAFGSRHVGVVESVDAKKGIVHTIEGNTSGKGGVARRTHAIGSGDFLRPNYPGGSPAGGGSKKSKLSADEIRGLAYQVGFRGDALDKMVAIVMAESGGKVGASHRNANGSIDRGLAQINSVHGKASTFNPVRNLGEAFKLFKGRGGFGDWSTFKSGAYKKFLGSTGSGKGTPFSGVSKGGDGGSISDAIQALKDFDRETARTKKLSKLDIQIQGIEKVKAFKSAIADLRTSIADKLSEAVDKFRSNWENTTGKAIDAANALTLKGFDAATDSIVAMTAASQELARLRGIDGALAVQKEDADNAKALADAQFLVAHSGGKVHEDALVQLADAQAQIEATQRRRQEDALEAQVATETAAIQEQRAIERANLEDQFANARAAQLEADVAGFQSAEQAKLNVLTTSLEAQRLTYADYVRKVNALLAGIGASGIDPSADQEAVLAGGGGASGSYNGYGAFTRPKKHASGGWTGLVLNELGPERVYVNRSGGVMVQQASEVARGGGGGGTVNYYGDVRIGSAKAARVHADRTAFRMRFGG